MSRIALIITAFLILPIIALSGQSKPKDCIDISILQRSFPGPNSDIEYRITGKKIVIRKIEDWNKDWKNKEILYIGFMNKKIADSLCSMINSGQIDSLDDSYSSQWLDGMQWKFSFNTAILNKEVVLSNYYLKELGDILDLINEEIPKKRRYISFEYFDIKCEFEKKDTTANTR